MLLPNGDLFNHEITNKLRTVLVANTTDKDFCFGNKIYISREGQALRFVENETETVALLEKYGFKKIIAEKFSYDDQINIMKRAKYLVAPHGAGITNIFFMSQNSHLLELASKPDDFKPITDYFYLASFLKINYYYQECAQLGKVRDFHQGSLLVDLEKLEKNLKLMLQND